MGQKLLRKSGHIGFLSVRVPWNLQKVKFLKPPKQICRYSPKDGYPKKVHKAISGYRNFKFSRTVKLLQANHDLKNHNSGKEQ